MTDIKALDAAATLLPCPFCGGEAVLMCTGSPRAKRGWYPTCRTANCPAVTDEQDEQGGTHFDHWTQAEAITTWNTRAKLAPADGAAVERVLRAQMEAQGDDTTPSSIQREKGLVWLEGWFDLSAALAALGEG